MAIEYRGEETIYAVTIKDGNGSKLHRAFNQTDGSSTISADEIELDTKDKTGSDYGKVTEEVSLEGIITEGDPFVDYVKKAVRAKEFVEIYEINTRTLAAEKGLYMVTNFERSHTNGEFSTYSLSGALNGSVTEETLAEVPEGAPDSGNGGDDDNGGGGEVEG